MDISLSIFLDIFIAVLLIVTIGYALTLSKRLGSLRGDKRELHEMALSFEKATTRAEASIAELSASIDLLQKRIKRAESLRDDLIFLVERGNNTADSLESLVRTARDHLGIRSGPSRDEKFVESKKAQDAPKLVGPRGGSIDTSEPPTKDMMSDAERQLIKALQSTD